MAKAKTNRGGVREGTGAPPRIGYVADAESPLMRSLVHVLRLQGEPSVAEIMRRTGLYKATVYRLLKSGEAPAALRSIEKILAAYGWELRVVPKSATPE